MDSVKITEHEKVAYQAIITTRDGRMKIIHLAADGRDSALDLLRQNEPNAYSVYLHAPEVSGASILNNSNLFNGLPVSTLASLAPRKLGQVDGDHYDSMPIDVIEFCEVNKLGFTESTAIKYIARRKGDSRLTDLKKARNCIDRLISSIENDTWKRGG